MKKQLSLIHLSALLILVFSACKKEAEVATPNVKKTVDYTVNAFAVQPLDQYFDGVKVRELHGQLTNAGRIAFINDNTFMELKKKGTSETIYQHTFNINDNDKTLKFFYDGNTVEASYNYPNPVGMAYTANFFFDLPAELGPVDIVTEIMEYYPDANDAYGIGIAQITSIPIATNIQTGKWSEYITLNPAPDFPPKTRPDSEFWPMICIKKAGTNTYLTGEQYTHMVDRLDVNSINLQQPTTWTSQGLVQSFYIGWEEQNGYNFLLPKVDLVQLFPK